MKETIHPKQYIFNEINGVADQMEESRDDRIRTCSTTIYQNNFIILIFHVFSFLILRYFCLFQVSLLLLAYYSQFL